MPLGEYLRERREAKKIGLREMARRVKLSPSYLSKVEHNDRQPRFETVVALAHRLGEDADAILLIAGYVPADVLEMLQRDPGLLGLIRQKSSVA